MTTFEDRLFDDLVSHHGAELEAPSRGTTTPVGTRSVTPRRLALAGGAVLAAAAVTVGVVGIGGADPAYAVTQNDDGTVSVTLREIAAIDPANARLRALGVRARAVPETTTCAPLADDRMYAGRAAYTAEPKGDDTFVVGKDVPRGYTVLIAVSDRPGRGTGLGFTGPVRDPAPSCLLDPAADPALRAP